jgi:hypothetical protein
MYRDEVYLHPDGTSYKFVKSEFTAEVAGI